MTSSVFAPPFAKYNADGSGRDTYIRRDPVECYGKTLYKTDPPAVTRFGAAGSVLPRDRPRRPGATDPVGGINGVTERPARYLRTSAAEYPVNVHKFSTMKEILQDANVSSQQMPGHLNHVSGYMGFQPRCPTAADGSADWASITMGVLPVDANAAAEYDEISAEQAQQAAPAEEAVAA